ncbi:nuclear cap-binding protein subunit 3 [Solea senegalensis]|uniref:Nuclear cap-binding protein subunit 3 n=1 Tax=Solea senegalensis TaxID=28829 RepID=A0AAV6SEW3_SOLSE|nr:nuclear cap-binding protein subunit 3 [Solea senegalensis]KAG7515674.1 nuclear cap-binding protein subunit 3 [Solea senegalensis]
MAAVRSLRVSVKSDSGSDRSDSGSESERDTREAEPMEVEVEEGELEADDDDVSVNRSLKELLPDTSRRYENKAGAFITGIDVTSKEAIERKEKRARRFHFCGEEESVVQRNVFLHKDTMKKAIPRLRLEAIYVTGVDDMSTQDVFGYFKNYPPAHIEWIDDTSCNVVWLDDDTSVRALINSSRMPDPDTITTETESSGEPGEESKGQGGQGGQGSDDEDCEEEGEVDEDVEQTTKKSREEKDSNGEVEQKTTTEGEQVDDLSRAERVSLLRNDLRPVIKPFRGNKLLLRFATHDDKKELGAARRSRYYMKYGNPNYGGMKGILSNSWKRRFHNRRIQRDVIKTKKPLIGDSLGHTPPYTHRHSADLVNLPEEPIKEEEEEEEDGDEDMDSDDRVVEYKERGEKGVRLMGAGLRARTERSPSPWSESDEMDYDLELKMISTPSPKKSKKMTMYADELDTQLKGIRNRLGGSGSQTKTKSPSPPKVTDVRQLLEEKRQGHGQRSPVASSGKTDVRQRLGKRQRSPSSDSPRDTPPAREPVRDIHRRLGVANQDNRGVFSTNASKERKTSGLWSRLGSAEDDSGGGGAGRQSCRPSSSLATSLGRASDGGAKQRGDRDAEGGEEEAPPAAEEEDDSTLQKMWGAMIKQKQERVTHKTKKSRLDNLPSLQIEISRDSSDDSEA